MKGGWVIGHRPRAGAASARLLSPVLGLAVAVLLTGGLGCRGQPSRAQESDTVYEPPEAAVVRPERLIVGITPYLPVSELRQAYAPLAEYLERRIGVSVMLNFPESYAALSRAFERFDLHVATLAPLNYVRVKQVLPGVQIIAALIADGSSTYSSYIVARGDIGVSSIDDLRNRRFAFVDRISTSGYLYPMAYFRSLGVVPETYFSEVSFAGDHSSVMDKLLKGEVDAGTVYSLALKRARNLYAEGGKLKIIANTGDIPYDSMCAHPRLDPELVRQLRAALLDLSTRTEEGRKVLGGIAYANGFVEVQDSHYDEVRRVVRLVQGDAVP